MLAKKKLFDINSTTQTRGDSREHRPHQTSLHIAAIHGRNSIVEYLLERGADVTKTDMNGKTAEQVR